MVAMKHLINRLWRAVRARTIADQWKRAAFYLIDDFPGEATLQSGGVFFSKFGLLLPHGKFLFVLRAYPMLRRMAELKKVQLTIENNLLIIAFDNLRLTLDSEEEIFIVREIFFEGTYQYKSNSKTVVFDIGMNVGFASIFFSNSPSVNAVYAFEPFRQTFDRAQINFNLNKNLAAKITSFHFGLSDKEEVAQVAYDYENKGQVGIYGTDLVKSVVKTTQQTTINLKKASDVLIGLTKSFSTQVDIILKIDCEGSEYDILQDLADSGFLQQVKIIFMEWHEKGPDSLVGTLQACGFSTFYNQSFTKSVGMIYGVR